MKPVRLLLSFCLLFIFSTLIAPFALSAESIQSFAVDATLTHDATLHIVETIQYDFGTQQRHGIFRDIPVVYTNPDGKKFSINLSVLSVEDDTNTSYTYSVNKQGNNKQIKIGDPDTTISGTHTYIIRYDVTGAAGYFSDHDEIYWNATGNAWGVPIHTATATLHLPEASHSANPLLRSACYTGTQGSTESACSNEKISDGLRVSTSTLSSGEGLTYVASIPKGIIAVVEPTPVKDWSGIIGWLIGAYIFIGYIVAPLVALIVWYKKGRDPKIDKTTVTLFDPPKDKHGVRITPIEMGALVDEVINPRDISAMIIHLAIKKYVKLKTKEKKLLGVIPGEIEIIRGPSWEKDKTLSKLTAHEKEIFNALTLDTHESVKAKDLKNTFPTKLKKLKDNVYNDMVAGGFFPEHPEKARNKYILFGVLTIIFLNFILGAMLLVLSRFMSRRTLFGAQAKQYSMGLKKFLTSQDDKLAFQEDQLYLFEKLLPYAIALGVAKIWAEKFEHLTTYQPDWYDAQGANTFTPVHLTDSLNSGLSKLESSYTPTSTRSSSGFSSGFSGGSSGGGFGGGGGGSW